MIPATHNSGGRHSADQKQVRSVLIVDDEMVIRELCTKALKGYRVLQAEDGIEALTVFRKGEIDVILTDVMMPRMGGIELLKKLKEIDPTLVVIVMTGYAEKDVILNALKADADDFITKPLDLLQLKTAIDKALIKKGLKEEIANLKSMDRFKSNFLSLISHKFRTPITAISLFLQNLENGACTPEDTTFKEYLCLTYRKACYLDGLVADLLSFSRVMDDSDGLKFESVGIADLVAEVVQTSREAACKPGVKAVLDIDPLPPVLIDRSKIRFVIKQMVDNAFKFSGETGKVQISLKSRDDQVMFRVEDDGPGIPKEEIPKIFEKFYQVDPAETGQVPGFGLGLYYTREFVKLHGGTVTAESCPGKGTRIFFILPSRQA